MKTTQALKFEVGIEMPLHDQEVKPEQLKLLYKLADSGERFIIKTNLTNKAIDLMGAAYRDQSLNTAPPLHFEQCRYENGLGVTKYNGVYAEFIKACEQLADEIDLPILINVKITPDVARELIKENDKAFIITGCHIMSASLALDLRGEPPQKNEFWMDDPTIEVPELKNEPCVNPNIPVFENEYNVKKPGDVIVPGVTLKQLQDKALDYDKMNKKTERHYDLQNAIAEIKGVLNYTKEFYPKAEHPDLAAVIQEVETVMKNNEVDDIDPLGPYPDEEYTEGDYRDE